VNETSEEVVDCAKDSGVPLLNNGAKRQSCAACLGFPCGRDFKVSSFKREKRMILYENLIDKIWLNGQLDRCRPTQSNFSRNRSPDPTMLLELLVSGIVSRGLGKWCSLLYKATAPVPNPLLWMKPVAGQLRRTPWSCLEGASIYARSVAGRHTFLNPALRIECD
jgi:hypothetical protein